MASTDSKTLTIGSRIPLADNTTIPYLGLGTWRSEPGKVQNIVREAILNVGYRHIDGAWVYENENEVGIGIKEAIEQSNGKIKREDLFVTTKLWNQHHVPSDVEATCRESLANLKLDYIDLYLIHWPVAFKNMKENLFSQNADETVRYFAEGVTLADTWKAMEKLVDLKLTRSIGISNFNEAQIEEILNVARIKPVVNQIELHPYLNQAAMRAICKKHNIVITSYCPLSNLNPTGPQDASASALYNPVILDIAKAKNKSAAQVILRWHIQHGLTVIPKTATPSRLVENGNIYDFELSKDEMDQIDQLESKHHMRMINPPFLPGGKTIFDD